MTSIQNTIIAQLSALVALPARSKFVLHGGNAVEVVNGSPLNKLHSVKVAYNAASDLYDVTVHTSTMPKLNAKGWVEGSSHTETFDGMSVENLDVFWAKGRRQAA